MRRRARSIHGDEKNGLRGQSPGNETSEEPRTQNAVTERNAVLILRLILDGIIRRFLFRYRSRVILAKDRTSNSTATEMRGRGNVQWATVERVGGIGREIARNGKLWSDDSTMRRSALETTRVLVRFNESSRMEIAIAFHFGNCNYCAGR